MSQRVLLKIMVMVSLFAQPLLAKGDSKSSREPSSSESRNSSEQKEAKNDDDSSSTRSQDGKDVVDRVIEAISQPHFFEGYQ